MSHQEQTRIMLRPIGSGLPLGFFSFGIGMLLLGSSAVGWVPVSEQKDMGTVLIAFVVPLEALATVVAFMARDTLAATTLGLFTTSWLALGWVYKTSLPGATSVTIGIYLFGFATAALLLGIMSVRSKPFFSALLCIATVRMVLSGIYEIGGSTHWLRVSGGFAIALTTLAFYGAVALGLEDAKQREVLPLFRIGPARAAFEGYESQLERLESEPGVRTQL